MAGVADCGVVDHLHRPRIVDDFHPPRHDQHGNGRAGRDEDGDAGSEKYGLPTDHFVAPARSNATIPALVLTSSCPFAIAKPVTLGAWPRHSKSP